MQYLIVNYSIVKFTFAKLKCTSNLDFINKFLENDFWD